jgi:hypothetical protein
MLYQEKLWQPCRIEACLGDHKNMMNGTLKKCSKFLSKAFSLASHIRKTGMFFRSFIKHHS